MSSLTPVLFLFTAALSIWSVKTSKLANNLALGATLINFSYFFFCSLVLHVNYFASTAAFSVFTNNQYGPYSEPFVLLFSFILIPIMIFNLQAKSNLIQAMTLAYGAASIACVTSNNLLAFLIAWELGAIASMFLVATGENRFRNELIYFAFHFLSGLLLLAATVLTYQASGSFAFPSFTSLETVTAKLFFIAFGIKVGFPVVNLWLYIAYPNAEPRASAALSIFSTKIAIYGMLMIFSGLSILVDIGLLVAVLHTVLAWFCVHYRAMLTHALNAQLGIIVCIIGIGSNVAIATAILMVIAHVLYKTYAFIYAGNFLQVTGSNSFCARAYFGDQSKLYLLLASLGCLLTAAPLTLTFIGKEYLYQAVSHSLPFRVILMINLVNALNFGLVGLKPVLSYFFFPGKKSIHYPSGENRITLEKTTLVALLLIAGVSLLGGVFPSLVQEILPETRSFPAYTAAHVIKQLFIMLAVLACFLVLFKVRFTPWLEHHLSHQRNLHLQAFRFAYLAPLMNNLFIKKHVYDLAWHFWVGRRKKSFLRYFGALTNHLLVLSRLPSSYLALWIISSLAICLLTLNLTFL